MGRRIARLPVRPTRDYPLTQAQIDQLPPARERYTVSTSGTLWSVLGLIGTALVLALCLAGALFAAAWALGG